MTAGWDRTQTTIGHFAVRYRGATTDLSLPVLRLRTEHLLGNIDLHPRGLPSGAVLIVRKLSGPTPLSVTALTQTAQPAWTKQLNEQMATLASTAIRPALGQVAADATSVLFADPAEMLACLTRDLLVGRAQQQWYWQQLLRDVPSAPGAALAALWSKQASFVPATLGYMRREETYAAVALLSPAEVIRVTSALHESFDLPALALAALLPDILPTGERSERFSQAVPTTELPEVPVPLPPWHLWLPLVSLPVLTLQAQYLLGLAVTLSSAPTFARSTKFAVSAASWLRSESTLLPAFSSSIQQKGQVLPQLRHSLPSPSIQEQSASDQQTISIQQENVSNRQSTFTQQKSTLNLQSASIEEQSALDSPSPSIQEQSASDQQTMSIRQENVSNRQSTFTQQKSTLNLQSASIEEQSALDSPSPSMQEQSASNRQTMSIQQENVSNRQSTFTQQKSTLNLQSASIEEQSALDSPSPSMQEQSASNRQTMSIQQESVSDQKNSAPANNVVHGVEQLLPTDGVPTELGGVLYLINLLIWFNLPDAWDEDGTFAEYLSGWAIVEALARGLLANLHDHYRTDPIWHLLALLDRREPDKPVGAHLPQQNLFRLPAKWLRRYGPPELILVARGTGERLLIHAEDAGYLVADLPLLGRSPDEVLLAEQMEVSHTVPPFSVSGTAEWENTLAPSIVACLSQNMHWWLERVLGFVRYLLAQALGKPAADPDLLAELLLCQHGQLLASRTHIDIHMPIDEIRLPIRRAGLDRDPGWVPDLGHIVLFHFD